MQRLVLAKQGALDPRLCVRERRERGRGRQPTRRRPPPASALVVGRQGPRAGAPRWLRRPLLPAERTGFT